jgi:hypothetical protein
VPDWIHDALESFQTFMGKGSLLDAALLLGISAIGARSHWRSTNAVTPSPQCSRGTACGNCGSATPTT